MKSFRKFLLEDVPNKEMGQFYQNMLKMQTDPNFNKTISDIRTRTLARPITNLFPAFGKLLGSPDKLPATTMQHWSNVGGGEQMTTKGMKPATIPQEQLNSKRLTVGLSHDPTKKIPSNMSIIDTDAMSRTKPENSRAKLSNFTAHEIGHNFQSDRYYRSNWEYSPMGDDGKPTNYAQFRDQEAKKLADATEAAMDAKKSNAPNAKQLYDEYYKTYFDSPSEVSARVHGAVGSAAAKTHTTGRPPSFEEFVRDAESVDNNKKTMDRLKKTYGRVVQSWQDTTGKKLNPIEKALDGATKRTVKGLGVAGAIADPAGTAFQTAADAVGGRFAGALGGGLGAALFINQSAGDPEGDALASASDEQRKEYYAAKLAREQEIQELERRRKEEYDTWKKSSSNPANRGPINKPKM